MGSAEVARVPDFINVGPPRTATTWLHEVLSGHVGLPLNRKETNYFTRYYDNGIEWYRDYFRHCAPGVPIGEISPMYFADDKARERIKEVIPDCKIICSFRDPVDRAYSQWRLMVRMATTRASFADAVERHRELRESGRYGTYLAKWYEAFGRDRVMVLIYEDIVADPQKFLDGVCRFIGIPPIRLEGSRLAKERVNTIPVAPRNPRLARNVRNLLQWLNDRRYHRIVQKFRYSRVWRYCFERGEEFAGPTPEEDARVRAYYRSEIEALEGLIGRDLSAWKTLRSPEKRNAQETMPAAATVGAPRRRTI
ncbi:MAG TPA: sulfotransferase [Candidatus Binataceae bacterium]|nr:sulfotransferase [Candidatus Binataceae bacterium]